MPGCNITINVYIQYVRRLAHVFTPAVVDLLRRKPSFPGMQWRCERETEGGDRSGQQPGGGGKNGSDKRAVGISWLLGAAKLQCADNPCYVCVRVCVCVCVWLLVVLVTYMYNICLWLRRDMCTYRDNWMFTCIVTSSSNGRLVTLCNVFLVLDRQASYQKQQRQHQQANGYQFELNNKHSKRQPFNTRKEHYTYTISNYMYIMLTKNNLTLWCIAWPIWITSYTNVV